MRSLKTKPPAVIRGVAAILGEEPVESSQLLPLNQIDLPQKQPRKYFDPQKMEQLVASIKANGILEPLLVRARHEGKFELVAGERRFRAAQALNLLNVPVVIKELSDVEVLEVALIENLQREDLNPVEEVEAILELLSLKLNIATSEVVSLLTRMVNEHQGKVTSNVTGNFAILDVLSSIGVTNWLSFATNRLPLLKLPNIILESLRRGELEYTKAKAIAKLKDPNLRQQVLNQAVKDKLSLAEIRSIIGSLLEKDADQDDMKAKINSTFQLVRKAKLDPIRRKKLNKYLDQIMELLGQEE